MKHMKLNLNNINKINIIILLTFILILNANIANSNNIENLNKKEIILSEQNMITDIDILDVIDGIGLNIIIKNNGINDIKNITLEIISDETNLIYLPKKQYEIPFLSSDELENIHVNILGFSFGLLKNYTKITFKFTIDTYSTVEGEISLSLIGPFTRIVSKELSDIKPSEGYILFCPIWSTTTYLINNQSEVAHTWNNTINQDCQTTYLLENGNLLRTSFLANPPYIIGGIQGRIEIFDWNDTLLWNYEYGTNDYYSHHDVEPLPNGNILLIAWERKTKEEAINAGRNPNNILGNYIWSDYIIEVKPIGDSEGILVWEWHAWDHLIQEKYESKENHGIVANHPELIDINFADVSHRQGRPDLLHINSIDYNEEYDQILLSIANYNEIWVIDHSTTIQEAKGNTGGLSGKGGDILYRWGNPRSYNLGTEIDQKFFNQHGAIWIESEYPGGGNILVFNNGNTRPKGRFSSIDEINPPIDENGFYQQTPNYAFKPKEQIWIYTTNNPYDMYSSLESNVLRLPNGNTLICIARDGIFLEVTNEKEIVMEYQNPYPLGVANKAVSRIQWYSPDYPGLSNLFNK